MGWRHLTTLLHTHVAFFGATLVAWVALSLVNVETELITTLDSATGNPVVCYDTAHVDPTSHGVTVVRGRNGGGGGGDGNPVSPPPRPAPPPPPSGGSLLPGERNDAGTGTGTGNPLPPPPPRR